MTEFQRQHQDWSHTMTKRGLILPVLAIGLLATLPLRSDDQTDNFVQKKLNALSVDELIAEKIRLIEALEAVDELILERLLEIDSEVGWEWTKFAAEDDQGITKLVGRHLNTRNSTGSCFSFTTLSRDNNGRSQLELEERESEIINPVDNRRVKQLHFSSARHVSSASAGVITRLSIASIKNMTIEDCPDELAAEYKDPVFQLQKPQKVQRDTVAVLDGVYCVRWARYGEADTLVAFQVIAIDTRTVTIAWKMLKQFPVPNMEE
jgi:hypothetical protein